MSFSVISSSFYTIQIARHVYKWRFKKQIELVRMPRRNIVARTWPNDHNIMQHPQMLREKFDHFQIWANKHATCRNISQQGGQTRATCCGQQCWDMLRWMLRSFGRGLTKRSRGFKPSELRLAFLQPILCPKMSDSREKRRLLGSTNEILDRKHLEKTRAFFLVQTNLR